MFPERVDDGVPISHPSHGRVGVLFKVVLSVSEEGRWKRKLEQQRCTRRGRGQGLGVPDVVRAEILGERAGPDRALERKSISSRSCGTRAEEKKKEARKAQEILEVPRMKLEPRRSCCALLQ